MAADSPARDNRPALATRLLAACWQLARRRPAGAPSSAGAPSAAGAPSSAGGQSSAGGHAWAAGPMWAEDPLAPRDLPSAGGLPSAALGGGASSAAPRQSAVWQSVGRRHARLGRPGRGAWADGARPSGPREGVPTRQPLRQCPPGTRRWPLQRRSPSGTTADWAALTCTAGQLTPMPPMAIARRTPVACSGAMPTSGYRCPPRADYHGGRDRSGRVLPSVLLVRWPRLGGRNDIIAAAAGRRHPAGRRDRVRH